MTSPDMHAHLLACLDILRELGVDERLLAGWAGSEGEPRDLFYSERVDLKDADIQALVREEYLDHIAWIERESGGKVFQVTVEHSIMGDLLDLYLAPADSEAWPAQLEGLRAGTARAWVAALDMPPSSNWFDVEFEVKDRALVRVG